MPVFTASFLLAAAAAVFSTSTLSGAALFTIVSLQRNSKSAVSSDSDLELSMRRRRGKLGSTGFIHSHFTQAHFAYTFHSCRSSSEIRVSTRSLNNSARKTKSTRRRAAENRRSPHARLASATRMPSARLLTAVTRTSQRAFISIFSHRRWSECLLGTRAARKMLFPAPLHAHSLTGVQIRPVSSLLPYLTLRYATTTCSPLAIAHRSLLTPRRSRARVGRHT